jgi:predicted metal-dependent phosphoesterase TrpH
LRCDVTRSRSGTSPPTKAAKSCLPYALAAVERAKALGLIGIPGVEVSTADGHLLGIGLETRPPSGLSFAETVRRVRRAGGLAVVPHPFQRSRHGVPAERITDCDGIEVFNAHTLTGVRNRQATRFAVRHGYPRFAGSDAHRPGVVGSAYTEVGVDSAGPTVEAVLDGMRAGRVRGVGHRIPPRQYFRKLAWSAKHSSARLLRGVSRLTGT